MYERRLKIFLLIVGLGMLVILARLAYMQLLQADELRAQAEEKLTLWETLPTTRGRIFDRRNRVLAENEPCYEFCLHYRMLTEDLPTRSRWVHRQLRRLRRQEGLSAAQAEEIYRRRVKRTWELAQRLTGATRNEMARAAQDAVRRVRAWRRSHGGPVREENMPHPIVTGLDEAQAVALRLRLKEMVGASVRPAHRRRYPAGAAACHIIGRLGPVTRQEMAALNPAGQLSLQAELSRYLPGDLIGKGGVEKACERLLRGRRGRYWRKRRTGQVVREVPPIPGQDVHLTLDLELQRELAARLGRPGAIVVLDVPTGEVLAMVSLPTYDLNRYRREFPKLAADKVDLPLWNRAVAVRYPPGSTFKPLAAMAGLASGRITPSSTFNCPGYLISPTYPAFRCWIYKRYHRGHGPLNVVGALEHSCNVYFYKLGQKLTLPGLVRWLRLMGFADVPGTGLPEERPGILPDPATVTGVGEARYLATGQGRVAVTPLHVANAMAAIARGGEFRTPLLVRELSGAQQVRRLPISAEQVHVVAEGMYRVVNSPSGTAYKYARDPEIEICGKTGTAQTAPRRVDSNGDGRIDARDRVVRSGDTAWFAGFAPYRKPRIAFAVVVEYAQGGGGKVCGPIARDVVRICRRRGYLD